MVVGRQSVFLYGIAEHISLTPSTMSDANESYNTQTTNTITYYYLYYC